MNARPLLLVMLVAGCEPAEPVPVQLTDPLFGALLDEDEVTDLQREMLDDAFGFWGLNYSLEQGNSYGKMIISLQYVPSNAAVLGQYIEHTACQPQVWVDRAYWPALAHEVGHVFELEHTDDPANIMHASLCPKDPLPDGHDPDDDLESSRRQDRIVERNATYFTWCIP